jgi:hypothetical protein
MATDPLADKLNERMERGRRLGGGRWAVAGINSAGSAMLIGGANVWDHKWESLDADVELAHPSYPHQIRRFSVWRITLGQRMILFAARELSANVWGFYVPAQ